jgi:hypothetical protein
MTDEELKALVAGLAIAQREMAREMAKTNQELAITQQEIAIAAAQRNKELAQNAKEVNKQLKELGKQIGGLGKKFGSFTEGLALPSMTKILKERFKMEVISPSVRVSKNGINAEIDVLAYANSAINEAYVVEVKSHLREEGISQLNEIMGNFRQLFPEHKDKKLYGIIAAVDISDTLKQRVLAAGFYVARIKDETFSLDTPEGFQAKCF